MDGQKWVNGDEHGVSIKRVLRAVHGALLLHKSANTIAAHCVSQRVSPATSNSSGASVLDFCCGIGRHSLEFALEANVFPTVGGPMNCGCNTTVSHPGPFPKRHISPVVMTDKIDSALSHKAASRHGRRPRDSLSAVCISLSSLFLRDSVTTVGTAHFYSVCLSYLRTSRGLRTSGANS